MHHWTVTGDDRSSAKFVEAIERVAPLADERADRVRAHDQIADREHLRVGDPHDGVSTGVAASEEAHVDLALPQPQGERVLEGHRWRRELSGGELAAVFLELSDAEREVRARDRAQR